MTTNCVLPPRKSYADRLYTLHSVTVETDNDDNNKLHLQANEHGQYDFKAVMNHARKCKGFTKTVKPSSFGMTGYNHAAVTDTMLRDIKTGLADGTLSRLFVIGGCDGSQWNRSYFTDLAEETPFEGDEGRSVILTMGCAKNRLVHSEKLLHQQHMVDATTESSVDHEATTAIPRIMDMGQCNDAYSAVLVAKRLAKELNVDMNELPMSFAWSHMEQKACAVLLTLLSMGVKNIRLGPTLPAYWTDTVARHLERDYALHAVHTDDVQTDLEQMMKGQ